MNHIYIPYFPGEFTFPTTNYITFIQDEASNFNGTYQTVNAPGIGYSIESSPTEPVYVVSNYPSTNNIPISGEEIYLWSAVNANSGPVGELRRVYWQTSSLLTYLDVTKNPYLEGLRVFNNNFIPISINVTQNTLLDELIIYRAGLSSIDVSQNLLLDYLSLNDNQLSSLDVSQNTVLDYLSLNDNQLSSLDVSQNTVLDYLDCDNNQLSSLDVTQNTVLTELYCDNNQLSSLDVSQNTVLSRLYCDNNQLSSLDVSQNTVLSLLECDNNQLKDLDLTYSSSLNRVIASNNLLSSISLSTNSPNIYFAASNNQLSSIDISNCNGFSLFSARNNQLTGGLDFTGHFTDDVRVADNLLSSVTLDPTISNRNDHDSFITSNNLISSIDINELKGINCRQLRFDGNQVHTVSAVNWTGANIDCLWYSNNLTTDAIYDALDQAGTASPPTIIYIFNNPAVVGGVLQDGITNTAAALTALADSKDYTLQLTP